jgi:hypothetical protein
MTAFDSQGQQTLNRLHDPRKQSFLNSLIAVKRWIALFALFIGVSYTSWLVFRNYDTHNTTPSFFTCMLSVIGIGFGAQATAFALKAKSFTYAFLRAVLAGFVLLVPLVGLKYFPGHFFPSDQVNLFREAWFLLWGANVFMTIHLVIFLFSAAGTAVSMYCLSLLLRHRPRLTTFAA